MPRADAKEESLAIPVAIRRAVDERDGGFCRVCGSYQGDRRAHHHIIYGGDDRGMGGRRQHRVDEIVTIGWIGRDDCHSIIHSDKGLWQPLLLAVVHRPGVTALQLLRWERARVRRNAGQRKD